jgi:hypothetical protein
MRRLAFAFGLAVPAAGVLAPQASAALTAREIRIANHPAFVRVVVDFTGGRVQPGEVNATDPNPFPDGFVRLPLGWPGVRTTADSVRDEGVFARIAQTNNRRITIRMTGTDRRFKYVHYSALRGPERLVLDLYKSRPPMHAAEIVRGRRGCLTLDNLQVTPDRVTADEPETAFTRTWSTDFTYPPATRQAGTLEAVALSAKDGTLDCVVQVRVRMGG